jgi:hypothetical protein
LSSAAPGPAGPLLTILLPTRDRVAYLRQAVRSVVGQVDGDWELVVSDNTSTEDVAGVVTDFADSRIHYVRTPAPLAVTDSWNFALEQSRGEYILMLGDDDAVLPRYFARMRELIERFQRPELIYTGAWLFNYPGVEASAPEGSLQPYGYAPFLRGEGARVVDHEYALNLVRKFMDFRVSYGFNMQFAIVRRSLVTRLMRDGPLYRSTYPDYYALNAMMLEATQIVADPEPLMVIGVTPKSHGFYFVNARPDEGRTMLDPTRTSEGDPVELPGSTINSGWLSAGRLIEAGFGDKHGLRLNTSRYRFLQAYEMLDACRVRRDRAEGDIATLWPRLSASERIRFAPMRVAALIPRLRPPLLRRVAARTWRELPRQTFRWRAPRVKGRYKDMDEVVADLGRRPQS